MGAPILHENTVEAFRECVLLAADRHLFGLAEALSNLGVIKEEEAKSLDPSRVRVLFDGVLKAINWTKREEVIPIISIFEDAYAESPMHPHSVHRKVDVTLAQDGFCIKEGQFMCLPLKSDLRNPWDVWHKFFPKKAKDSFY